MKKAYRIRSIVLAGSLLLQLNTLCFHARSASGDVDLSFDPGSGVNDPVAKVVVQPDGKVLVGGPLTFVNGTNRYGDARLNADGSLDGTFTPSSFNPDFGVSNNGYDYAVVDSATVQLDGKVLAGGHIVQYEQSKFQNWYIVGVYFFLTRLNADGSRDTNFASGATVGVAGPVGSIALQSDGKVLVGGFFLLTIGTNMHHGIVRFNANGSLDSSFDPRTSSYSSVNSVAVQPDGNVLIGGDFTTVNDMNRNRIARLHADGSVDTSFNPGTGASGTVRSITLQSDGKVLIGGDFTAVNGTNRNRIARLNDNGSLDNNFNPGTGADGVVRSIALQPDGNVLIAGDFLQVNGVLRPHVARLYGDSFAPSLNMTRSNGFAIISWPATALNFQLQHSTNLSLTNSWSPVAQPAMTNSSQISVTLPTSVGMEFFRLKSQ